MEEKLNPINRETVTQTYPIRLQTAQQQESTDDQTGNQSGGQNLDRSTTDLESMGDSSATIEDCQPPKNPIQHPGWIGIKG